MKLKDFFDLKELQDIQDQFSDATGLAAIALDAEGNYITKGSNFTDFCMKYTRGSEEGSKRCVKCDTECTGTYFCHAGLMDFSSDIVVNGEKVGSIIGGQVLPGEPDEEKFINIARELKVDEKTYIAALKKVPVRTEKQIRAAAAMLGNVVNQLVNLAYFKSLNNKTLDVFNKEIGAALENTKKVKLYTRDLQGVASKENILAINAAIEAAGAGQYGAGFSVVAKQIGELSKKSSSVYEDIQKLMTDIETSITNMNNVNK